MIEVQISQEDLDAMKQLDEAFALTDQDKIDLKDANLKYRLLEDNIILYKQGNREAMDYIIKRFHGFLCKFTKLICYRKIFYFEVTDATGTKRKNIDSSLIAFLRLYISQEDKKDCTTPRMIYYKTVSKIHNLFADYSFNDIYNQLVLALLNMANKYKVIYPGEEGYKPNGTFYMYVSKCFHYDAYKYLDELISKPFNQVPYVTHFDDPDDQYEQFWASMPDEEADLNNDKNTEIISRQLSIKNSDKLTMIENDPVDIYDEDALNFNWTNGITCSEIFSDLSNIEREIIVLNYIKKMSVENIAKIYRTSKTVIRNHRDSAIEKIKRNRKELNI